MGTYYYGNGVTVDSDPGSSFEAGFKKSRLAKLLGEAYQLPEGERQSALAKMMQVDAEYGLEAAKALDPRMRSQQGAAAGVQSTYIDDQGRRIAIMRDGSVQVLGNNAPQNQIIDTGDGFFGVNKSSLRAAPVQLGGPQQPIPQPPQQPQRAQGEMPFAIDPSLPPEVQAAIRANEGQWANATEANPIQIGGQQGGGQLRSVPKPQEAQRMQMEAERLRLAQEAAQRAGNADARAQDAAGRGSIPPGMRLVNGVLERMPGMPAATGATPKLTEDQNKSAGYALRMEKALNDIAASEKIDPRANLPGMSVAAMDAFLPPTLANYGKSPQRQNVEAAQLDALDAALTLNTGAAYTKEQLQGLRKAYFPQPGDDKTTVASKKARLEGVIQTARLRARGAYPGQQQGSIPTVSTKAQFDALPSGTEFIEDGQKYRKP